MAPSRKHSSEPDCTNTMASYVYTYVDTFDQK